MVPALATHSFEKRESCYYNRVYGYYGDCNWERWGRWVVLGAVVLFFLIVFFILSCITARRRRKRGAQPFYGTGWMAQGHGPVMYNPNAGQQQQYYNQQAAPPYSAPNQGYYGENQGYYGGQQAGMEMQPPANSYQPTRGTEGAYAPPAGPPPGKDGIIR